MASSRPYDLVLCQRRLSRLRDCPIRVKLEEQILITEQGHELLTRYPFEEELLE